MPPASDPSSIVSDVKSRVYPWLKSLEVDRAVLYGLLQRLFEFASGPVTLSLIAFLFSPELQGFYYTFGSLLALQTFVELGFLTVIAQFASHEWSHLSLDERGMIVGDPKALSRLASLARFSLRWFAGGGVAIIVGLGIGGYFFFSSSPDKDIHWLLPWASLSILTGITFMLNPMWAVLEGCNQIPTVYTFRFYQSMATKLLVWCAILSGAGLWVTSVSSLAMLLYSAWFLKRKYSGFWHAILSAAITEEVRWREEVWPMQWRFSLSGISGYFAGSLFVPVLFKYHGPVIAGQMGMTWAIISLVGTLSASWVYPKVPMFGMLIAQKKYEELDALFWRLARIVVVITGSSLLGCVLLIHVIRAMHLRLAARLLDPLPLGLFVCAQFLIALTIPMASYLRAHKKEPLLRSSLLFGMLMCISNLVLGRHFSALGMAVGYCCAAVVVVPYIAFIWQSCRKQWHSDAFIESEAALLRSPEKFVAAMTGDGEKT